MEKGFCSVTDLLYLSKSSFTLSHIKRSLELVGASKYIKDLSASEGIILEVTDICVIFYEGKFNKGN